LGAGHRDHFVVGFTNEEIKQRMRTFTSNLPDDLIAQSLDLQETSDFKIKKTRISVKNIDWIKAIKPYTYRPFDNHYICYLSDLIDRDRFEIMQHILEKDNLVLSLTRRLRDPFWQHVFVSQFITDKTILSSRDNCYCFPLYLYQTTEKSRKKTFRTIMMLFEPEADYFFRKPNFISAFLERIRKAFKKTPAPEEIFYYIYAVLYSETYRTKYAEFLKIDFPRVPFTKDYKLFKKMSEYGNRLADLHLLKSPELDSPIARFQGKAENRVKKVMLSLRGKAEAISKDEILRFAQNDKLLVYINKDQYFESISQDVWQYQIGGYQVCDKWLKDRKDRVLSLDEIQTYCKIVTAIQKTLEIQKNIDSLYVEIENTVLG
jgi:predicted helicase